MSKDIKIILYYETKILKDSRIAIYFVFLFR